MWVSGDSHSIDSRWRSPGDRGFRAPSAASIKTKRDPDADGTHASQGWGSASVEESFSSVSRVNRRDRRGSELGNQRCNAREVDG